MKIIGITGTMGAGKGTIVDYLTTHKGFTHYSVRGYLIDIIKAQGKEVNRDSMVVTAVGEVSGLKAKGNFHLFSVDAGRALRYERIVKRGSETDLVSFETFAENEDREMSSTDPNKQNVSACMALADYHLINNGTMEDLYREVDRTLEKMSGNMMHA